jgi:hypothetical protein
MVSMRLCFREVGCLLIRSGLHAVLVFVLRHLQGSALTRAAVTQYGVG